MPIIEIQRKKYIESISPKSVGCMTETDYIDTETLCGKVEV